MKIKINFSDFWSKFNVKNNYFYKLLSEKFEIEISDKPDYLFFSVFGENHKKFNCKKIFYTGENIAPNMSYCDYSFSFDEINDKRNYRLPHYILYNGYYDLIKPKNIDESLLSRKFCNFMVSNGNCPERNNFFIELSKYKKVDSGGKFMNNIGSRVSDKRKFQSEYKFSLSFENNAYRHGYEWYITEKIMDPMTVNSIPIYKGGSKINKDFNEESFVNCHRFSNLNDVIDYIVELYKNDEKYLEMMREPWLINNEIPSNHREENIKSFLYNIFQN